MDAIRAKIKDMVRFLCGAGWYEMALRKELPLWMFQNYGSREKVILLRVKGEEK